MAIEENKFQVPRHSVERHSVQWQNKKGVTFFTVKLIANWLGVIRLSVLILSAAMLVPRH